MKAISKGRRTEIAVKLVELTAEAAALGKAIDDYNNGMLELRDDVEDAIANYNERRGELKGIYEEIADEARTYYDERSERWQEGDAGSDYATWVETLENFDIEEIEIELPADLEMPDIIDFEEIEMPAISPGEM